jgi:hypothetical protein
MGKDNHRVTDFKVPIPYIPEDEKEADPSDGKPPSVKLLLDSAGKTIYNPMVQVQPIFNGGTTEQFFKWFQSLSSLIEGQAVGGHFCVALQALRGMDKALKKREMDLASPKLAVSAGLSEEASEKLWYDSIMKLTIHVLKDPRAGFKQVRYMEGFLWIGKHTSIRIFMDPLDILSTYLPLFPPMTGEVLKELSDRQKPLSCMMRYHIIILRKRRRLTLNQSRCLSRTCSNLLSISKKLLLTLERILSAIIGISKSIRLKPQFVGSRR